MTSPGSKFLAALIFLSGCATMRVQKEDERLGRYRFNYAVEADASCGLVQAFDDGAQTFVQVLEKSQVKKRKVRAKDGTNDKLISAKISGAYIVLNDTAAAINLDFNTQKKSDRCKKASIFLIHSMR